MALLILLADDDSDFHLFVKLALLENGFEGELSVVIDGQELMDFLNHTGKHPGSRVPDLIILDLNMPLMDGREALREIKTSVLFSVIPVVILSSSDSEADLQFSRDFLPSVPM